jgi:peptidyl-dipeptidase Dcp
MDSNPVLASWSAYCYGAPRFESVTPQHILPALQRCIEDATAAISEICINPEEPTFANTVIPYETDSRLEKFRQVRSFFISVVNTVESFVSEKAPGHQLLQDFDQHACQISLLERFNKVPIQNLANEDSRLVRVLIEGFISRGTTPKDDPLSQSETASLLKTELVSLRSAYAQAVKDHIAVPTELVLSDPSPLDAQLLSAYAAPGILSSGDSVAGCQGSEAKMLCYYRVPNHPDVVDRLLANCSVRSVRQKVWTSFRNRGKPANYNTAQRILIARSKLSSVMGFQNHASFKMRQSMVSDPTEVLRLYQTLLEPAKRAFQSELCQLLEVSAGDGIIEPRDFMQWDYKYYSEKLRKGDTTLVSFEELPTFKLSEVMRGFAWLVHELYGVTMLPACDAPKYHEDILSFSFKNSSNAPLGLLYVDIWARPGKASGNWTQQITRPCSFAGSRPIVSLNCNFKRLYVDDPEGLNFDHVKLLLHEFGHCLHCLYSDVKYPSLSGMTTPDDHVELPSLLHEKFLHDPRFLSRITTSPLPVGTCSKLMANDCKSIGYTVLRSISSSILDLRLHTLPLNVLETLDVEEFERNLYTELGMPPQVPYIYESSAFDHIFRFDYRYYM